MKAVSILILNPLRVKNKKIHWQAQVNYLVHIIMLAVKNLMDPSILWIENEEKEKIEN